MENYFLKVKKTIDELYSLVWDFQQLLGSSLANEELKAAFHAMETHYSSFSTSTRWNNLEEAIVHAENTANDCINIAMLSLHLPDDVVLSTSSAGQTILEKAAEVRSIIESKPINLEFLQSAEFNKGSSGERYEFLVNEQLKEFVEQQERHDQRVKKLLNENELRIVELERSLKELGESAQGEIDKIKLAYSDGLRDVEVKRTEIDEILGHVSGRAIAGDYAKSATDEKEMADWLRIGSLICMGVIAASLIYSLFETIHSDFNWQQSLFRITLTFLLSVPAAYLARESAKHREQQYQHQQTSLDLKALSPFVASLPDEEQHKIKIAIASKIFAGRDFSKVGADSYPINTQEIIMEIIKKLDVSKKPEKSASE